MSNDNTKKILLLLPTGFEMLEASAFIDVFGWNMLAGDKTTQLFCTGSEGVIATSFGHNMQADIMLSEVNIADFAALALPGGFARYSYFEAAKDQQIMALLHDFVAAQKPIAAICTGALILGAAGLLREKKATTYRGEDGRWLQQLISYGAILSDDNPCLDGNIITSADPSSAVPGALLLLEMLTTTNNALHIKKIMGY